MNVGKGSHPNKVKVFGPGVERTGLKANEPTHFTVDCSGAGDGNAHKQTCARTCRVMIKTGNPQRQFYLVTAVSICVRTIHAQNHTLTLHLSVYSTLSARYTPTVTFLYCLGMILSHTPSPGVSWRWSQGRNILTGNSSLWPSRAEHLSRSLAHSHHYLSMFSVHFSLSLFLFIALKPKVAYSAVKVRILWNKQKWEEVGLRS